MGLYLLDRPPAESACSVEEVNTCYIMNLHIRSLIVELHPLLLFNNRVISRVINTDLDYSRRVMNDI